MKFSVLKHIFIYTNTLSTFWEMWLLANPLLGCSVWIWNNPHKMPHILREGTHCIINCYFFFSFFVVNITFPFWDFSESLTEFVLQFYMLESYQSACLIVFWMKIFMTNNRKILIWFVSLFINLFLKKKTTKKINRFSNIMRIINK